MKNRGPILSVKNKLQGQLLQMVFAAIAVPTVILGSTVVIFIPFFPSPASATSPDEYRTWALLAVLILFPILMTGVFYWAFYLTNRLVGPVDRMIRELDARIQGSASGPIKLRPKDLLIPLADKINELIAEMEKHRQPPKG